MNINSLLCIGKEELFYRNRNMSNEINRRVVPEKRYHSRYDTRSNSVVRIYSPANFERPPSSRHAYGHEKKGVVACRLPDHKQSLYHTEMAVKGAVRHRTRTADRLGPRRELAQSARERLLSNVTDVNYLLCRGFNNGQFRYGHNSYSDNNGMEIRRPQSSYLYPRRPVRNITSHVHKLPLPEVPKIRYVTEIVQPCSVVVASPNRVDVSDSESVRSSSDFRSCILRTKSAPPATGMKAEKRVSFGPDSVCGESTA